MAVGSPDGLEGGAPGQRAAGGFVCLFMRADFPVALLELLDIPLFLVGKVLRVGRIGALGFARSRPGVVAWFPG